MASKMKILIFGATGHLGKYMVKASVSMGHPTYAYVRPAAATASSLRLDLLRDFESMGVLIFQGELNEHDKMVSVLQQVDVVISTLAVPQVLDQLNILHAIKDAGNIKRFIPSEFGLEADRVAPLPPLQEHLLDHKKKVRRAIEAARIPYTYISANCFASYFIDFLLNPHEQKDEIVVYGTGKTKAAFNFEGDIATYTIKAANDHKTRNRLILCKPEKNIVSQIELISLWEKKTGRTLKKVYFHEQEMIRLSQSLPHPDNMPISVLHSIFVQGDTTNFDVRGDDLEASELYPDYECISIDQLLDVYIANPPPKSKLAAFA